MDTRAPTHPPANKLRGFGLGQLDDADAVAVMSHLDNCPSCQKEVAAVSGDYFLERLREARGRSGTPLPGKSLSELARSLYATIPPTASAPTVSGLPPELANHPQYEIVSELGRGGMGVVYLARHRLSGRHEVLKVMNKELMIRSGSKERFLREIQSAAMLDHPNVVKMYTAMEMGDLMVLVMEYVKGEDLAKLVKAKGRLPVPNACFYAHQVALGLQHAFEKGMVHRDIKPQNVILAKEGKKHLVKVLDFGLAKVVRERGEQFELTGQGQMLGTPDYIAPEQTLDATNADIRADIYSLGCSLYFLLAGRAPFKGKSLFEILQAHQSMEAKPLNLERIEVPKEVAAIVAKMMAKDPTKRFQQPKDVAQALAPFFRADSKAQPLKPSQDTGPEKPTPEDKPSKAGNTIVPLVEIVEEIKDNPKSKSASGSHWELLTESDVAPKEARIAKKKPRPTTKSHPAKNKKMLLAAGVLGGILVTTLIGLLAAGVFKVKTKEGILIIEVNEPNAEVYVDGEKVTVSWDASGKKTEIQVKPGTHQIELMKDGFTAEGERVTLAEGGHEIVSARLEKVVSGRSQEGLDQKDSEVTDLESLQVDLTKLVYARNPNRLKIRNHALDELGAAKMALAAGKTRVEIQEHLDRIQKDIEALSGVAENPENKKLLANAEKTILAAIRALNSEAPKNRPSDELPRRFTNTLGMEFVMVPKGKALLGGGEGKLGNKDVRIPTDFYLGKYEVTQEEWEKVTETNPSFYSRQGGGKQAVQEISAEDLKRFPVEGVSWKDARLFIDTLNAKVKEPGWVYRLPTEVEWEYACRGGPATNEFDYSFDFYLEKPTNKLLPDEANIDHPQGLKRPCKVGSYKPNRLGLYDMHGNVGEWCDDVLNDTDGRSLRAFRGGTHFFPAYFCRAGSRATYVPTLRGAAHDTGLRVARVRVDGESDKEAKASDDFVPLLNGKDLSGWKTHPKQPGNWRVEKGILIGSGPLVTSHLYTLRDDYKDFHLRLEARINEGGNSGVYFRAPFGPTRPANDPRWLNGYNAKIDGKRLGGFLLDHPTLGVPLVRSRDFSIPAGQWLTLEVIVQGNHIVVKTNGETTADYVDEKRCFASGHIALQQHTPTTEVEFRKLEIKELPAPKTEAAPLADGVKNDDEAEIAKLTKVLLDNTWYYHDNLFPPGEKFRFNTDGTFHFWKWNYWVVGPRTIRVHYDRKNHNKETGVLFTFNPELTKFTGEFTDDKRKLHKITGTRQ
jgi:serine/threonine protein kinase/formylglycine-generating enzyme required for sulfatase activity